MEYSSSYKHIPRSRKLRSDALGCSQTLVLKKIVLVPVTTIAFIFYQWYSRFQTSRANQATGLQEATPKIQCQNACQQGVFEALDLVRIPPPECRISSSDLTSSKWLSSHVSILIFWKDELISVDNAFDSEKMTGCRKLLSEIVAGRARLTSFGNQLMQGYPYPARDGLRWQAFHSSTTRAIGLRVRIVAKFRKHPS